MGIIAMKPINGTTIVYSSQLHAETGCIVRCQTQVTKAAGKTAWNKSPMHLRNTFIPLLLECPIGPIANAAGGLEKGVNIMGSICSACYYCKHDAKKHKKVEPTLRTFFEK